MPEDLSRPARAATASAAAPPALRSALAGAWRDVRALVAGTVAACLRFRVTGLAAEGGFFALLSLPPLVYGLVASLGYLGRWLGQDDVAAVRGQIARLTESFFTSTAISDVILPTFDSVTTTGRADLTVLAFAFSVWSGSRALNVYVDTIAIMYGLGGHRGIVATRALSFVLYVLAMVTGALSIPLVVAGPTLVDRVLPERLDFVNSLYWPLVLALCICFLATLYHVSVPVRTKWTFNLPGATFSLFCWVAGSYVLRWVLTVTAAESRSIYGPLAAPIAVLLWLYLLALAVLIGAAVNAAFDTVFPQKNTTRARLELVQRLRGRISVRDS